MKTVIDLSTDRVTRNERLLKAIVDQIEQGKMSVEDAIHDILDNTLGSTILDDELEENLVISLANAFDCVTKNPQHDLNGGYEGNDDYFS